MTAKVSTSERFIPILNSFAERFHQNFRGEHRLASPLGAWCLLAYLAVNDNNPHPKVVESLGCTPQEVKQILKKLLKKRPEVIAFAVKSWLNPSVAGIPVISSWAEKVTKIASPVAKVPDFTDLNAWAREASDGFITEFPVDINRELFLALFTNLVATEIDWDMPYKSVPDEIMNSAWDVTNVLVVDKSTAGSYIYQDKDHGLFGVHQKYSKKGDLFVTSVIALNENVTEEVTMSVARKISLAPYRTFPAKNLPLGESADCTLSVIAKRASSPEDTFTTYLPAWKSSKSFDLAETNLGFREALDRFESMGGKAGINVEIKQGVDAEYSATGFKASSRTFGLAALRSRPVEEYDMHHVTLRFNQPYAVVASVNDVNKTWNNIPVFDGWVAEASEITIHRRF